MARKLYELTPEHRKMLGPWADRWIANAMSTAQMTDEDRSICIEAVHGLYAAAKLPPPKHIVFVPSPFVLSFAGGFAASIWYQSRTRSTGSATRAATQVATWSATGAATEAATRSATQAAARAATGAATRSATEAATDAATEAATEAATWSATWAATRAATDAATEAATRAATWSATEAATRAATDAATEAATRAATDAATWAATQVATWAATRAATEAATRSATRSATQVATEAATDAATEAATRAATWSATEAATRAATQDATEAATWAAARSATQAALNNWYVVPADMRLLAAHLGVGDFGLRCAAQAWRMWQGGNQWSGYDAYLSFFQDIAHLSLPQYESYRHWRALAEHSGPRIVHPDFCMISDRPEILEIDDRHRPHSDAGPFCRWRDGTRLYSVHGVRVPAWLFETPERLSIESIEAESNTEVQRVMIERFGWEKYVAEGGFETIDHDDRWGTLRRRGEFLAVEVINRSPEPDGSFRHYLLPVAPQCELLPDPADPNGELGEPQELTALNAVASTFGLRGEDYAESLRGES